MDVMLLVKFFSVFAFVIGLMMLLSWGLKKISGGTGVIARGADKRRLKIVEFMQIDHKRRLVLIRRDDKEHLLVLGTESETVIETGIPISEEEKDTHVVSFARDHRNVKI